MALALGGLGLGACLGPVPYPCERDEQCVLDGREGVCEPVGYCSLPDDDCDGGRRFTEHAPAELAQGCVDADDGGSSSGGADDQATSGTACADCSCVSEVMLSMDRSCAVAEGRLWCWGLNDAGQLGDPADTDPVTSPRLVAGLEGDVHDVAIDDHACAVTSEGVFCWGRNAQGQVSQGRPGEDEVLAPTPTMDPRLTASTVVAVAERWSCALYGGGSGLLCWGDLGFLDGESEPSLEPVGGVAQQLVMTRQVLCVRASGQVYCAGDNIYGELGVSSSTTPQSATFVQVPGIENATGLAAAGRLICAWNSETVTCWGRSAVGEGGVDPMGPGNQLPTPLTTLSGITRVARSQDRTCAVTDLGVQCWGQSLPGLNPTTSAEPSPSQTWIDDAIGESPVSIHLGTSHACVLSGAGEVWCWGDDDESGQLGIANGGTTPMLVPVPCEG